MTERYLLASISAQARTNSNPTLHGAARMPRRIATGHLQKNRHSPTPSNMPPTGTTNSPSVSVLPNRLETNTKPTTPTSVPTIDNQTAPTRRRGRPTAASTMSVDSYGLGSGAGRVTLSSGSSSPGKPEPRGIGLILPTPVLASYFRLMKASQSWSACFGASPICTWLPPSTVPPGTGLPPARGLYQLR